MFDALKHVHLVYQKLGYIELVGRAEELSMHASVEEVQALPDYITKGEVRINDRQINASVLLSPCFKSHY